VARDGVTADVTRHDARLARIQRRFGEFAAEYAALPLYSSLCRHLAVDEELASLLLAARPGQARPVLWLAAVHELVLRHPDSSAAQWYPSVTGGDGSGRGDPWPDVRQTVLEHSEEVTHTIGRRRTQTNEVNRAVHLGVGLAVAAADLAERPVALVELGASAGLLLGIDRYAVELTGASPATQLGDQRSPVRCSGTDRSGVGEQLRARGLGLPRVVGRVGVDLDPVQLDDDDAVRWLEACLWPDVPGRVERFRAARALLRADPPEVLRGDLVEDLARTVAVGRQQAGPEAHIVVLSSWALNYVPVERRLELEGDLYRIAQEIAHLSWLSAEPPGCVPGVRVPANLAQDRGGTVVGVRRWRDGREVPPLALGSCHPHGQWVDLDLSQLGTAIS
jgi:hypothetical protein